MQLKIIATIVPQKPEAVIRRAYLLIWTWCLGLEEKLRRFQYHTNMRALQPLHKVHPIIDRLGNPVDSMPPRE